MRKTIVVRASNEEGLRNAAKQLNPEDREILENVLSIIESELTDEGEDENTESEAETENTNESAEHDSLNHICLTGWLNLDLKERFCKGEPLYCRLVPDGECFSVPIEITGDAGLRVLFDTNHVAGAYVSLFGRFGMNAKNKLCVKVEEDDDETGIEIHRTSLLLETAPDTPVTPEKEEADEDPAWEKNTEPLTKEDIEFLLGSIGKGIKNLAKKLELEVEEIERSEKRKAEFLGVKKTDVSEEYGGEQPRAAAVFFGVREL